MMEKRNTFGLVLVRIGVGPIDFICFGVHGFESCGEAVKLGLQGAGFALFGGQMGRGGGVGSSTVRRG